MTARLLPGAKLTNGVSSFIFGANTPNYDPDSSSVVGNADIQGQMRSAGVTIIRFSAADQNGNTLSDTELNTIINGITVSASAAALCILPHGNNTYAQHVVTLFGSKCLLYEYSNERDINGMTWQTYLSQWNGLIPSLRSINSSAAFIGPVLGAFSNVNSFLLPWLAGTISASTTPDALSVHIYPCTNGTSKIPQATCSADAANIGNAVATLRSQISSSQYLGATSGAAMPICVTEWNADAYYNNSTTSGSQQGQGYNSNSTSNDTFNHAFAISALDSLVQNGASMANLFEIDYFLGNTGGTTSTKAQYTALASEITKYLGGVGSSTLTTSPTSLTFTSNSGSAPASQTVTLANSAASGSWTSSIAYSSGSGWLSVSPTSGTLGTTNTTITFSVTLGTLISGTYSATVTFTLGSATAQVAVTFTVSTSSSISATALSLYQANAASTTLSTADQFYTVAGSTTPTETQNYSLLGTATGYGEVTSQGTTSAWAAAGSLPAPTGKGFLYDSVVLEGNQLNAGTYTANVRLTAQIGGASGSPSGSFVATIYARFYKYNSVSSTYTSILTVSLAAQTINSSVTTYVLSGATTTPTTFSTADKVYVDIFLNVTSASTSTTQYIRLNRLSTDTAGKTGDPLTSYVTPGYQTIVGNSNGQLSASGGNEALLLLNNWTATNLDINCTMKQSDAGGLAWRVIDTQDFYEVSVRDSAAPSNPNTIQCFKTVAGARTTIGTSNAAITFPHGTSYVVRVTMSGSTITVYFNSVQIMQFSDTALTAAGQVGMRNTTNGTGASATFTAFHATSLDSGSTQTTYTTITDTSVPSHNYIENNNFTYGNNDYAEAGSLLNTFTFPQGTTFGPNAVATMKLNNNAIGSALQAQSITAPYVIAGQQYCFSAVVNVTGTLTNSSALLQLVFQDIAGTTLGTATSAPITSGSQRFSVRGTCPLGTITIQATFGGVTSSTTNSGTVTFTSLQLEPMWFPTLYSYPTPICDFLQPDCVTLPDGTTARNDRIFTGFITHLTATYEGITRLWDVECTATDTLLETAALVNAAYVNISDQSIITGIVNNLPNSPLFASPANFASMYPLALAYRNLPVCIAGVTIADIQFADATIREIFNALADITGFTFGVDPYYNVYYYPPFYNQCPYGFSSTPDNVTTFPYYDYSIEYDGTQLKNAVRVIGTTYTAAITETFAAGDGTHNQYINSSGQTDNFQTTYSASDSLPSTTTMVLTINGVGLSIGPSGDTFANGWAALYNPSNNLMALYTPIASGSAVSIAYHYDALAYVEVHAPDSVAEYGGAFYSKISDTNLGSNASAVTRGEAELQAYAQPRITIKFKTQKIVQIGQVIVFTSIPDGIINGHYIVQKVTATYLGNGINQYEIEAGTYVDDFVDFFRNTQKALARVDHDPAAPIQQINNLQQDSLSISDSLNIHT